MAVILCDTMWYYCGGSSLSVTAASQELIKLRRRAFTVQTLICRLCKFESDLWQMWDKHAKNWCSYSLPWTDSYLNAVTKRCSCVMSDTLCWTLSPYSRHQSQALSGRPAVWFDDNTDCLICKICINHPTVHIQQSGLENTFRKRETYEAGKMYVRFSIHSQAGNARHGCWMQGDCQHIVYVVHIMYIYLIWRWCSCRSHIYYQSFLDMDWQTGVWRRAKST